MGGEWLEGGFNERRLGNVKTYTSVSYVSRLRADPGRKEPIDKDWSIWRPGETCTSLNTVPPDSPLKDFYYDDSLLRDFYPDLSTNSLDTSNRTSSETHTRNTHTSTHIRTHTHGHIHHHLRLLTVSFRPSIDSQWKYTDFPLLPWKEGCWVLILIFIFSLPVRTTKNKRKKG